MITGEALVEHIVCWKLYLEKSVGSLILMTLIPNRYIL